METLKVPIGCVHGRFQPFHLGHLEYVLKGFEVSDLLYIGLANSGPSHTDIDPSSIHRHCEEANPFHYFERMEMLLGSLSDAGVDIKRIRIVPFPINVPDLLKYYVPLEAVQLVTIYDEWGEKKLRVLKNLGYQLEILWRREKKFTTGTDIRRLLKNSQSIEDLVPPFVNRYIEYHNHFE
jgi:cytidyltransferase-like protein